MKKPFITKEEINSMIQEYPTPFYLYDEKGIENTIHTLQDAFKWNKGFKEYFAVKATPTPAILKIMKEEGCGVDTSSYSELVMSDRCGFKNEEIMFSSNDTPQEDYALAKELNAIINLDDISHIDMLDQIFDVYPTKMSVRYNPGGIFQLGESKEGFQVMDTPEESKFGMSKPQIFDCLKLLKERGVKEFGLHSFIASNTISNEYYPYLSKMLFELAKEIEQQLNIHISFINLSGGIGVPYKPKQKENDISYIGNKIHEIYDEMNMNISIYTELGRYMLAGHGALITRVIHLKHSYREYVGVDSNSCNLLRPAMYGAYHHITVLGKENDTHDHVYDVVGSLCENNDKFAIQRELPKIEIGDILYIHDVGAHGFSMGYNYNGRLRCAELLLKEDGSIQLIRRSETIDDYFSTLIW